MVCLVYLSLKHTIKRLGEGFRKLESIYIVNILYVCEYNI